MVDCRQRLAGYGAGRGEGGETGDACLRPWALVEPRHNAVDIDGGGNGDVLQVGLRGICLRRDNWVSVRYAEELNSGKSSVLLQRADRHGILGQKPADLQRHS